MPFSDEVLACAWRRAGGRCECTRTACGHPERCGSLLHVAQWNAHHILEEEIGGASTLANCEALCFLCYGKARRHGRSRRLRARAAGRVSGAAISRIATLRQDRR